MAAAVARAGPCSIVAEVADVAGAGGLCWELTGRLSEEVNELFSHDRPFSLQGSWTFK